VRIDGLAASAAVLVAMSGKTVRIQDSAYMMIHDPSVFVLFAELDIEFMDSLLGTLKSVKTGILDVYAARTGLSRDRLTRMMSDTFWMSASEAVNLGFAHEVIAGGNQSKNPDMSFVNALRNYAHVPPALLQREREAADRYARDVQKFRNEVRHLS
jgi:ATP-dependent Clp protease protease subunit